MAGEDEVQGAACPHENLWFGGLSTPQLFDAELLQNAKEAAKTKKDGKA